MGNRFEISVVADQIAWAEHCIEAAISEIRRIEKLLTTYDESSETNQINLLAGIEPVRVNRETFQLIERSLKISAITQGAFDISYGSVDRKLWNFDCSMTKLPDPVTAKKMVRLINYRNIELNHETSSVFLKEKGMRIGFGGIGKGYAAERAKFVIQRMGADSGVVNASGDLVTWGHQPNGKHWTIGIAKPDFSNEVFAMLDVSDQAFATSGNYEKFVLIGGKKYSHTIDPRTGLPVQGIKSVTVITPNAELADAMTTPIMIMGKQAGLNMINQMKDIAAIIIDDDDNVMTSKNIRLHKSYI